MTLLSVPEFGFVRLRDSRPMTIPAWEQMAVDAAEAYEAACFDTTLADELRAFGSGVWHDPTVIPDCSATNIYFPSATGPGIGLSSSAERHPAKPNPTLFKRIWLWDHQRRRLGRKVALLRAIVLAKVEAHLEPPAEAVRFGRGRGGLRVNGRLYDVTATHNGDWGYAWRIGWPKQTTYTFTVDL